MAKEFAGNKDIEFGNADTKTRLYACPLSHSGGHLNPLQPHWLLCNHPAEYRFSSAIFYEEQVNEFGILTNFSEVF